MPFVAQCPYCGQKGRVADHVLAGSVQCPRCQNWYTAAPADDLPAPRAPLLIAPASASCPTPPEPAPASPTAPPVPAPPMPPPRRRRAHPWIHLGGLAACLLGSLGLLAASLAGFSFLTIPMSAAGLAIGIGAVIHVNQAPALRHVLPIAGTLASSLVLAAATVSPRLLGPVFQGSRQPSGFSAGAVFVVPLQIGPKDAQPLEIDGWADASRAVLHQDRVRVQIVGVAAGPVQFTVPKGLTKENYLSISLMIQHLGHGQQVAYIHWGAAGVRPTPHPVLTQSGRKLTYHQMETEVVAGQVRQGHTLYPGKAMEDLLLFDGAVAPGEALRLELPAEAWGVRGVLKFHIPAAMVQQRQPTAKGKGSKS